MVDIERLNEAHVPAVKKVRLSDEQIPFAGTAEEFLSSGNETTHLHILRSHGEVVGFFKIDTAYPESHSFCPQNTLGLRTFAISENHQGKGMGTSAIRALFPYLKQTYAAFQSIYLTVNCKNPAARACYLKGGFEDTGEQYLGGEAGPQHIMRGMLR